MTKVHTVTLDSKVYNLGYKVVTDELKSLGLRRNPNILTYPINEWYCLPEEDVEEGNGDWGGIWTARTQSGAKGLARYMKKQHSTHTRLFKAALDDILYFNSYRVKTNGIMMFEEIV